MKAFTAEEASAYEASLLKQSSPIKMVEIPKKNESQILMLEINACIECPYLVSREDRWLCKHLLFGAYWPKSDFDVYSGIRKKCRLNELARDF